MDGKSECLVSFLFDKARDSAVRGCRGQDNVFSFHWRPRNPCLADKKPGDTADVPAGKIKQKGVKLKRSLIEITRFYLCERRETCGARRRRNTKF